MPKSKHRKNRKPFDAGKIRNIASIEVDNIRKSNIKNARLNEQGIVINQNGKPTNWYMQKPAPKVSRLGLLKDALKFLNDTNTSVAKKVLSEQYIANRKAKSNELKGKK